MNIKINSAEISGEIEAISSKSYAHRALICASLGENESEIYCNTVSDDIIATVNSLNSLGASIIYDNKVFKVSPIKFSSERKSIDCGESGSTLRFLIPIVCAFGLETEIVMHGRLPYRPLSPLKEILEENGCKLEQKDNTLCVSGKLKPNKYEIDGSVSSQFISGLLFALPIVGNDAKVVVKNRFESKSYVDLTLFVLKKFGIVYSENDNSYELIESCYKSAKTTVEGDWSNAAFWLCAGGLLEKGLSINGLSLNSVQGDKKIVDLLKIFGAKVSVFDNKICVKNSKLKGSIIDASNIPDLVPIICVLACFCKGQTVITNAERLRIKESDRIKSTIEMINNLGGNAEETADGILVNYKPLVGGRVNSYNDHRIAMSAAIASVLCKNEVIIYDAGAVKKSYPMFFDDFKKLGAKFEEVKNNE